MRRSIRIALPVFLLASCQALGIGPAGKGAVQTWGTLREALRDGEDHGRVSIAEVAQEGVWGVGALEGLLGEITIQDGEVWISEGRPDRPITTRAAPPTAQATVLFAAEVEAWQEIVVEADVDPSEINAYIAAQADAAGIGTSRPFPFVVEGGLCYLHMHVIAGECPMRARMLGEEMTKPPFELQKKKIDGRLVGIYAEDSSGIICHHDASSHVHVILDEDGGMTGHVETVGLVAGAVLKLPLD